MIVEYPAYFIREGKQVSVTFPDLNGITTCGDDYEDACFMAMDLLAGWLWLSKGETEQWPQPSNINALNKNQFAIENGLDADNVSKGIVTIDVTEYVRTHF